ncbi:MAG: hypothetical protein AAGA48_12545 [Myxococcota bacterium]
MLAMALFAIEALAHPLPVADPETASMIASQQRLSLPAAKNEVWEVVPLDDGWLLLGEGEEGPAVASFDQDFGLRWSRTLPEAGPGRPLDHAVTDDHAWLVYARRGTTALVGIPRAGSERPVERIEVARKSRQILGFEVADNEGWLISGRRTALGGTQGVITSFDLDGGRAKTVSSGLPKKSFYERLATTDEGAIELSAWSVKKRLRVQHLMTAKRGELSKRLTLQARDFETPINPLSIQRQGFENGESIVVGSYADEVKGSRAQGLYMAHLDTKGNIRRTETHSFTEMNHFFDHLSERRQRRIAERLEKKKRKGDDIDLDVRFDVHQAVQDEATGNVIVVGEAYYPVFETRTQTTTQMVNGRTVTTTTTITEFRGFRFTHAVAVAFSPQGELVWDASLSIGNVQSYAIKPHVRVTVDGDRITMIYASRRKLFTRVFDAGTVVDDRKSQRRVDEEGEKVRRVRSTSIEPWTDEAFLAWGIQKTDEGRVFVVERLGPEDLDDEVSPASTPQ